MSDETLQAQEPAPEAPGVSEDDALAAAFDSATQGEEIEAEAPETLEAAEQPEAPVEAPRHVPLEIGRMWGDLSDQQRDAISTAYQGMSARMADQGRKVAEAEPVLAAFAKAAEEVPQFRGMKPAEMAEDVVAIAKFGAAIKADPARTLAQMAQHYGAADALRQMLGGQAPNAEIAALKETIADLQARLPDEDKIGEVADQRAMLREARGKIDAFALERKEHWSKVEPFMPAMIEFARSQLGEGASYMDILNAAYDMALNANPATRKAVAATVPDPSAADPERARRREKAASLTVKSAAGGKGPDLTEDQVLAATYDRMMG